MLDFTANDPANPAFGSQIAEVLTVTLSGRPGFRMVEWNTLSRMLQEQEL